MLTTSSRAKRKKRSRQLKTDEERENFIESFWRRRDPNPDTEENEYREEYYERIAYANEHYASGIPGWKTDRGRIYITLGKPDSVESHPTGGAYDRPSYEGGGSTTTYPFEIWFYRHLDRMSATESKSNSLIRPERANIASPAVRMKKTRWLNVPGAGLTTAEQLGLIKQRRSITGINAAANLHSANRINPFRRMEIIAALQRPPQVKFSDLQASLTDSRGY